MKYPNFNEEKKLWKKGYRIIVGLDEAGRGSLAGPVVAAAVWLKKFPNIPNRQIAKRFDNQVIRSSAQRFKPLVNAANFRFLKIKDSKKLTLKKRKYLYKILVNHPAVKWGIGKAGHGVIDKINILEATKLAMGRAVLNLEKKLCRDLYGHRNRGIINCLIIDGNFKINLSIPQKSIIKADETVFSCVIAGIVAKVSRDKIMLKYDKKYPKYGFAAHKGYPTKHHREMLEKYGSCQIHRKTFKPVLENQKSGVKN